jgi:hypothetical protein
MAFKPHYGPGEAILYLGPDTWISSPYRMFRAGLMCGDVSIALFAARHLVEAWNTDHYFKSLHGFTAACVRKWEFQANIADRFTRPGVVFH